MKKPVALLLVLALAMSGTGTLFPVRAASSGDDWPMFRHDPAGTGATTSSAPMKPVELWRYAEEQYASSTLSSSAVVVNGVVYAGSFRYADQSSGNIFAFDAYTGTKIWNYSAVSLLREFLLECSRIRPGPRKNWHYRYSSRSAPCYSGPDR